MSHLSMPQVRGLKDLIQDTVEAGVTAAADTHRAIAHQPYALLAHIGVLARPVRTVEHIQQTVTDGVYDAILAISRCAGATATRVIDWFDTRPDTPASH